MNPRLDLEKSIQKQRLIYKMSFGTFFIRVFDNYLWIILILLPIAVILNKQNNIGFKGILFFSVCQILLIVGLYFVNKLVVIEGTNQAENRKKIISIVGEKFPKLKIDDTGQRIIRAKIDTGLIKWGKKITIIFDEQNIFINCTTLGRDNMKSPIHSIYNYFVMLRLKKHF